MDTIPISCPTMPDMTEVLELLRDGVYADDLRGGDAEASLEAAISDSLDCEHAVTVSSSTFGLILALAAMEFPAGREIIVPSFAFGATIQAIYWNGLTPVFVDCLPGTMTIDPDEVVKAITPATAAIVPVTVFGLPPDIRAMDDISRTYGVPVIFDSSQGLGSLFEGKPIGGFGLCEVFSLNSEMVVTAAEGGVVVTKDSDLADKLRAMRQWGRSRDGEDTVLMGVSSRIGSFNATIGLLSLRQAGCLIDSRLRLIDRYRARLERVPGCGFQQVTADRKSNGTYFAIFLTQEAGRSRDQVHEGLKEKGIQSRRMFFPPAHAHQAFRGRPARIVGDVPNTWAASLSGLALPLYSHMTDETVDRVCEAVEVLLAPDA